MQSISGQTRAVGNSSGVLLPREWLNKKVVVTLSEPNEKEILQDVIEILYAHEILRDVLGIYLVGSRARGEEEVTSESDIDLLVITNNLNKTINKDNYQINIVKNANILKSLKEKPFYYYPMIYEAKPLLNEEFLTLYKSLKIDIKSSFIKDTKKLLKQSKNIISLDKRLGSSKTGDVVAYSLILRLRGFYIINKLSKKQIWKREEFLNLVKKVTGNLKVYERYLYSKKGDERKENTISIKDAEKIINYLEKEFSKWENTKRGRGRKD